jgi:hypothetical protein
MRITPKFLEALMERGATEFELAAFGYLEPAVQVSEAHDRVWQEVRREFLRREEIYRQGKESEGASSDA